MYIHDVQKVCWLLDRSGTSLYIVNRINKSVLIVINENTHKKKRKSLLEPLTIDWCLLHHITYKTGIGLGVTVHRPSAGSNSRQCWPSKPRVPRGEGLSANEAISPCAPFPLALGVVLWYSSVVTLAVESMRTEPRWSKGGTAVALFFSSHLGIVVASIRTHARSLNTCTVLTPSMYKQTYNYT